MSDGASAQDLRIREAALAWCEALRSRWGDAVPAAELRDFPYEGARIVLKGQQGIFKPKELQDGPLSIRTSLESPYHDRPGENGEAIRYDFSPHRHENEGLKRLRDSATPLIYLVQVKGIPNPEYLILSPVFIVGWDEAQRAFHVEYQPAASESIMEGLSAEKRYGLQLLKSRLHQAHFRKAVLAAYRSRCAVCDLRARPLLDGAHIIPDALPGGDPVVQNGISFCALHHRAFDRRILTVDENYLIEIDTAALGDRGAAAQQSLLYHHGRSLILPNQELFHPDPERLRRKRVG